MSVFPQLDALENQPLITKGAPTADATQLGNHQPIADSMRLILEERIKKDEHPLDSYYRLAENAKANKPPEKEDVFRFKWQGLFYLTPVESAFMARLRIPGGQLKTFQLREIAAIASELTTGYIQITTRANLQIRLIEPKNAPEVLRRIQSIGLHTRGAGADNIRNLTLNPTAGIDPFELIDCTPYVHALSQFIISQREFYDLPRKFNIAFDGGGLIGAVEDTNDIGVKAVRIGQTVAFRIALGGATGHKAFARDLGVLIPPSDIVDLVVALVRVYIANGNRGNRKLARLKHLLEKWTIDQYLAETEKVFGKELLRVPPEFCEADHPMPTIPHSHVGAFAQKQEGLHYLGVTASVGQLAPRQLQRLADIADHYGSSEIRLTVWQNLIIPNIATAYLETVKKEVLRIGLDWQQSNVASGVIACTGNTYCKFSATDTKGHALALIKQLEHRVPLDVPVNIHFTGCPHSCAQHYIGDIGLLGMKSGRVESYHVFVGGGFGESQAVGRQVFKAIPFAELPALIEKILLVYTKQRLVGESFRAFTARHELETLQAVFSAPG
jgi:ferredoxin-nitrite reductase